MVNEGVFQLLATRGGQTSDVWYLSQAESKLFPLLSVIALLPLIPQNMRTNLLILDDIESSMSPETRDHVVNNFRHGSTCLRPMSWSSPLTPRACCGCRVRAKSW